MNNKYEFTGATKVVGTTTVKEIRYLYDIPVHHILAGDIGGFLESTTNLEEVGTSAIKGDAVVLGGSMVLSGALVEGNAQVKDTVLNGDIIVSGGCQLENSRLQGKNIRLKDVVYLKDAEFIGENIQLDEQVTCINVVSLRRLKNFTLTGRAELKGTGKALILGGTDIYIGEAARLIGSTGVVGKDIQIRHHAYVGEGVLLEGEGIRLCDHSEVLTRIILSDNVMLSEYARLMSSRGQNVTPISHLTMASDVEFDVDTR